MRPLSADQILQVWELGQTQHPLDRAITLLSLALPEQSTEEIVRLSIGQRDTLLLMLRELTFGAAMESFATCPHCGEALEFTLNAAELRGGELAQIAPTYAFAIEDYEIEVSLPNSRDLAAIVGCQSLPEAHHQLAQRCIRQVSQHGAPLQPHLLPQAVLRQLAQQMADCDPQAELLLDLSCPACTHRWQVLFDIVSFFWTELSVQAKRLLREVHMLAQIYSWREADILSMSALRRQFYLDLVGR